MDFDEVYRTYFSDVYRYVLRLSGEEHIAQEITAETFLKALRAIDGFRGECDLRTWLCQIAKNAWLAYLKKQSGLQSIEEIPWQIMKDPAPSPEAQFEQKETLQQLRSLLHTLPEPYKEVFMWRVFAQLSFREIGDIYRKTDNWACVTYHRARKMLKSRLEEGNRESGMRHC